MSPSLSDSKAPLTGHLEQMLTGKMLMLQDWSLALSCAFLGCVTLGE